jgi:uncharacterized protein (TIGR02594 family)
LGLTEVGGVKTNPTISAWLKALKAWWEDDETPWCGVFVAHCMQVAKVPLPKNWMRAKAWLDWGEVLTAPIPGCVVVFDRQGGGHVGFVLSRTTDGRLVVLGGNQGNKVCAAPFEASRVAGYRWPVGVGKPTEPLQTRITYGVSSTNEV